MKKCFFALERPIYVLAGSNSSNCVILCGAPSNQTAFLISSTRGERWNFFVSVSSKSD